MNRADVLRQVEINARGCWIWQGGLNSSGYGPHVQVYTLWNGPPGYGAEVDHKCLVKACVNPDHLREMSRSQNWRREWARRHGRQMSPRHLRKAVWLHKMVGDA